MQAQFVFRNFKFLRNKKLPTGSIFNIQMWDVDFQRQACGPRSIPPNSGLPGHGTILSLQPSWVCTITCQNLAFTPQTFPVKFNFGQIQSDSCMFWWLVLSSYCANQPLKEASKYFAKQGIPFPTKVPDDQETPHVKECYIVGDKESPETPIVIFFPLVNDTFREYKAPGKFTVTHYINTGRSRLCFTVQYLFIESCCKHRLRLFA